METLRFSRAEDQIAPGRNGTAPLDPAAFLGSWANTNRHTDGLARLVIAHEDGVLTVRAFGACTPEPCDWGAVPAHLFAENAGSHTPKALQAHFDLGFMQTSLQAFTKLNVLVVALFTRFADGSGRAPYFDREFFYRIRADEAPRP